jgi:hypothetical protein
MTVASILWMDAASAKLPNYDLEFRSSDPMVSMITLQTKKIKMIRQTSLPGLIIL